MATPLAAKQYTKLANQLPSQLIRFFKRYPPQAIVSAPSSTLPADSAASSAEQTAAGQDGLTVPSPFRSQKHPITGKWHDPVYSLRRQADLLKMARQHGVEELMPFSVKSTEEKLKRRLENGLRVKGTGVGQRVKGKESERTLKGRLEKRRKAMLEMPQMIQTWKERGHGRGWKKWPK
ncbi:hypothetical protein QTJ16_002900 [Diplocarpon rosae]|uniref:Large ribosomal subunit protein mL59 domain-containing protein n=1 Tax=Diplocarpon rosae TaxID=946125 RepID=A0AAD9T462_9HELO|nr:hypothetical protein QTJ16_002900 [Diplocarpon rosae]PBP25797.1 60S ribosomal protein [Diplocarpon rosae]